jgi:hypothetical protein
LFWICFCNGSSQSLFDRIKQDGKVNILIIGSQVPVILIIAISVMIYLSRIKPILAYIITGNFFFTGVICLAALTIFLNRDKYIMENKIVCFLSFFLLPNVVAFGLVMSDDDKLFVLPSVLAFNITSLIFFILFQRGKL